jgi:hypothetical protein
MAGGLPELEAGLRQAGGADLIPQEQRVQMKTGGFPHGRRILAGAQAACQPAFARSPLSTAFFRFIQLWDRYGTAAQKGKV